MMLPPPPFFFFFFLRNCLNHEDEKIIAYSSMVLFTCLNMERMRELQEEKHLNVALAVLQASRKYPESEWA